MGPRKQNFANCSAADVSPKQQQRAVTGKEEDGIKHLDLIMHQDTSNDLPEIL